MKETKIKDYLQLIITFSVAIAVFLLIRPFIQLLLNKFIAFMTSSQIGTIGAIIIEFGIAVLDTYILYSLLVYIGKKRFFEFEGEKWK